MRFDDDVRRIRARLLDPTNVPDGAAADLARIAEMTQQEPAVAAVIAERVRADRLQRRHEVHLPLGTPTRTIDETTSARCVAQAGCGSLAATAMLELEEQGGGHPEWAKALVAVAGDLGVAHLARMRVRPRWSDLSPSSDPRPHGLDALVSPIADVRRDALDGLARTPRPEHVRALLLAAELDRYVIRNVLRLSWRLLEVRDWFPLLLWHKEAATRLDEKLANVARGYSGVVDAHAATRANYLLVDLVDANVGRSPMGTPQELSRGLQELETDGVVAYAARHMADPRLTDDDRILLEDAEFQLASSALLWAPLDAALESP